MNDRRAFGCPARCTELPQRPAVNNLSTMDCMTLPLPVDFCFLRLTDQQNLASSGRLLGAVLEFFLNKVNNLIFLSTIHFLVAS